MPSAGYIKLWRSLQESPLWNSGHEPFTRGQAWVDLLMLANYKDRTILLRGVPVLIKRGQVARSEVFLVNRWRWSRQRVRRFLAALSALHQTVQQTSNVTSIITIINYETYQGDDTADDTAHDTADDTAHDTADDTAHDTAKEEGKKERREEGKEEEPPKPPRGHPRKKSPVEVEIPEGLRCECFTTAWGEWLQHRKENGWKNTPTSMKRSLLSLEKLGTARATAAIEHSIEKGWRGIFEKTGDGRANSQQDLSLRLE